MNCPDCGFETTRGQLCNVCKLDRHNAVMQTIFDAIDKMPNTAKLEAYTPGPPQGVTWAEYEAMADECQDHDDEIRLNATTFIVG